MSETFIKFTYEDGDTGYVNMRYIRAFAEAEGKLQMLWYGSDEIVTMQEPLTYVVAKLAGEVWTGK